MASATAAMHFGAGHPITSISRGFDRTRQRVVEAWPPCPALEFSLRFEQRLTAPRAGKRAVPLFVIQGATARSFSAVAPEDIVLFRGEQAAPLLVGMGDFESFVFHLLAFAFAASCLA